MIAASHPKVVKYWHFKLSVFVSVFDDVVMGLKSIVFLQEVVGYIVESRIHDMLDVQVVKLWEYCCLARVSRSHQDWQYSTLAREWCNAVNANALKKMSQR